MIGARGHYLSGGKPQHALGDLETIGRHREQIALSLFPQLTGVRFTHNWGGSVGVPRQWHPHIMQNRESGMATAGGYVGEGVGASFLFGHTLADLLTEQHLKRGLVTRKIPSYPDVVESVYIPTDTEARPD